MWPETELRKTEERPAFPSLLLLWILVKICSSPGRKVVLYEPSPAVLGVEIGLTVLLTIFGIVRFVQIGKNR